jgi:hypothetical protein
VALIAATPDLLHAVAQVSAAKERFRSLLTEIKALNGTLFPDLKRELSHRHPILVEQMRGSGLARLHLMQCWRSTHVADAAFQRVRLSLVLQRSSHQTALYPGCRADAAENEY